MTNDLAVVKVMLNNLLLSSIDDKYLIKTIIVKFFLDFSEGKAAESVNFIYEFMDSGSERIELYQFIETLYMVTGNILINKNPNAINNVLKDKKLPNSDKCRFLLAMMEYFEDIKEESFLKDLLKKSERYVDNDFHLILRLADKYMKINNAAKSLSLIHKLSEEDQSKELVMFTKARSLNKTGKFEQAIALIENIDAELGESTDILDEKAVALMGLNRFDEAESLWKGLLEKETDNWKIMLNLAAFYYLYKGDNRKSLHYLLESDKLVILHPSYYLLISEIYDKIGLKTKKFEFLQKAGIENPEGY